MRRFNVTMTLRFENGEEVTAPRVREFLMDRLEGVELPTPAGSPHAPAGLRRRHHSAFVAKVDVREDAS